MAVTGTTVTRRLPTPLSALARGQERILARICLEFPERSTARHDFGRAAAAADLVRSVDILYCTAQSPLQQMQARMQYAAAKVVARAQDCQPGWREHAACAFV
jgi:hypothetical protein